MGRSRLRGRGREGEQSASPRRTTVDAARVKGHDPRGGARSSPGPARPSGSSAGRRTFWTRSQKATIAHEKNTDQNEPEKEKSRAEGGGGVCHCRGPGPAHLAEAYEALCPSSSGQVAGMVFSRDRADPGCGCRRPPPRQGPEPMPPRARGVGFQLELGQHTTLPTRVWSILLRKAPGHADLGPTQVARLAFHTSLKAVFSNTATF